MGTECREEEAGVPRRGQAFGALKTSGKHRELLPRLPPGLPGECPGRWLSGKEAASLEEQIWVPSHLLWELLTPLWMGLPSPECAQGQAPICKTEPHQMMHRAFTPPCSHTPPAEATRGSLVGGGQCGSSKCVCEHLPLPAPQEGRGGGDGGRALSRDRDELGEAARPWA